MLVVSKVSMGWNIGSLEYKKLRIWEGAWEKCQIKN